MPPRSYFLSPGLSDYANLLSAYTPDKYEAALNFQMEKALPYLPDIETLALYIGIDAALIRQILHRTSFHYRTFQLKKRNGQYRTINSPRTYLKVTQWWILDNILNRVPLNDNVHGFRIGRSFVTNANFHLGAKHILNVGIEKYFDNVSQNIVIGLFSSLGYSDAMASTLARISCLNGRLPQGSPCSPYIANTIFASADKEIYKLCESSGFKFTRYADDITISAPTYIPVLFLAEIERIVSVHGFRLNKEKTRFSGLGDRMEVTGLVINERVSLPREWRYRAKALFHQACKNPTVFKERLAEIQGTYGALLATDPGGIDPITRKGYSAIAAVQSTFGRSPRTPVWSRPPPEKQ